MSRRLQKAASQSGTYKQDSPEYLQKAADLKNKLQTDLKVEQTTLSSSGS